MLSPDDRQDVGISGNLFTFNGLRWHDNGISYLVIKNVNHEKVNSFLCSYGNGRRGDRAIGAWCQCE